MDAFLRFVRSAVADLWLRLCAVEVQIITTLGLMTFLFRFSTHSQWWQFLDMAAQWHDKAHSSRPLFRLFLRMIDIINKSKDFMPLILECAISCGFSRKSHAQRIKCVATRFVFGVRDCDRISGFRIRRSWKFCRREDPCEDMGCISLRQVSFSMNW